MHSTGFSFFLALVISIHLLEKKTSTGSRDILIGMIVDQIEITIEVMDRHCTLAHTRDDVVVNAEYELRRIPPVRQRDARLGWQVILFERCTRGGQYDGQ
jgi:hypothetical protein